ncbi:MAG: L,D-transpeptidase [Verrucomicrobia bacterium]|nr:L,D-transpeptidase [Verrucomicrobiota bacterium]MBV9657253.1 L,D-transpeptidase [Verrucomicrobiota bacterium]
MLNRLLRSLPAVAAALVALATLPACTTNQVGGGGNYNPVAYRPHNSGNVRVKVSLANQAVYVLEGDKPLLVAATNVGIPSKPTPRGSFRIYSKIERKRSGSYGFRVQGNQVVAAEAGKPIPGTYVGYPMAYWCEFAPAYGFHQGYVWPQPRTHGCLRLHHNVAPKFFALVKIGTPVNIAQTQPEDETIGRNLQRPTDYNDPDPPASYMVSNRVFEHPPENEMLRTY